METPAGRPSTERTSEPQRGHLAFRAVNLLLLVPLLGLFPMIFNKDAPRFIGLPFFYWYQFLWIAVSVVVTVIVYRSTRGER